MSLKLYNTLTQQIEELKPLKEGQVRMYTCGPTVYHYVHIGNFRTFVFQDILRRYLRYRGWELTHIMNITDVEDKIIAASRREGVSITEYTERYTQAFLEDMQTLRLEQPEVMPKATEHIPQMVELILRLQEKGFTYRSDGSTYYRISRFPDYGKLSHLDPEQMKAAGRVDADEYSKENPRDFVLWKGKKEGEAFWESPLGPGRPGWHIECSAMSMAYLGESFDLHCGGVDLIFPHHENEIAQSEAATGKPFVRHWVHGAHLIVEGQKMSKSLGNFYTLRDLLERGCHPLALRYLLLSVHYRKPLNFTFEGVEQAHSAIQRVNDLILRLREIPGERQDQADLQERILRAEKEFEAGMDDDLNTSAALAAIFELVKEVNLLLEDRAIGAKGRDRLIGFFYQVNRVLDVFQVDEPRLEDEEIRRLIEERAQARRRRDYQRADQIRNQLAERGILLEDTKEGTRWKRLD